LSDDALAVLAQLRKTYVAVADDIKSEWKPLRIIPERLDYL
jgi:hypothetical protein